MLCDDILAARVDYVAKMQWVRDETKRRRAAGEEVPPEAALFTDKDAVEINDIYGPIEKAQRFVLSPLVVQSAQDLADRKAVERSREHLFIPADSTWLEWEPPQGGRVGILLRGERKPGDTSGLVLGIVTAFAKGALIGDLVFDARFGMFDFHGPGEPIDFSSDRQSKNGGLPNDPEHWKSFGYFVCAVLALINTPRVTVQETFDHRKLNKAREAKGRPALLSWKQVTISPDVWVGVSRQLSTTMHKALHHVRAHLRLKRGRVEIVRPHWRGDPRYGVRLHRYAVRRIEDERGSWEGGVLPMPMVLP